MTLPDWARAHGPPLFTARLRSVPEDFEVIEACNESDVAMVFTGQRSFKH